MIFPEMDIESILDKISRFMGFVKKNKKIIP